jgi:hypothetical protein
LLNDPGPNEALSQLDYLRGAQLAAQGKTTSEIDHKTALAEARPIDGIKWRKKDECAAALESRRTRTISNKG